MARILITRGEAQIVSDVLALVLNDPDWQGMASASDYEWDELIVAAAKIRAAAQ